MDMMNKHITKISLIAACAIILLCSCAQNVETDDGVIESPSPAITKADTEPETATSQPVNEEEASPKLQGDADEPVPTVADIEAVTKHQVTSVLSSDSLVYELPVNKKFAVALREDITKGVRWLLASQDGNYKLLEEGHINGYRVFVFSSDVKGETTMVYELESGGLIADTLSYRLFLGVKAN